MEPKKDLNYHSQCYTEDEISFYELWLILCRRKKLVLGITFLVILIALIKIFFSSPVYKTEVTLMPIGGKEKNSNERENFIERPVRSHITVEVILKSRVLRERIVKRLNLLPKLFPDKWDEKHKKWILKNEKDKPPTVFDGAQVLKNLISVSTDKKTDVITLSVEFKNDPEMAYKIAKAAIDEAHKLLSEKFFSIVKRYRIYIEKRLQEAREILENTEELYKKFVAGKINEISLPIKENSHLYEELKNEFLTKEETHNEIEGISPIDYKKIKTIKKQIAKLKKRMRSVESSLSYSNYVSLPEYLLNLKKLQARLDIALTLYEILLKEYELAKTQEMREQISFQVIDPPYIPKAPYKPKKRLILLIGIISGFFLASFIAFFIEWLSNIRRKYQIKEKSDEANA